MSWVLDMEKRVEDAEQLVKVSKWPKHCIFRVPSRFKKVDSSVYQPQTVSLGPFHHGDQDLKSMDEHKLRAVHHLLKRRASGKACTLENLVTAVEEVADELEDCYMDLNKEWRGKENRGKFLEMMITDGCFLLEVMRTAIGLEHKDSATMAMDYAKDDPVFSSHGIRHIKPFVQRDMLLVENQLPLKLLQKIITAEEDKTPIPASINNMVLKFLGQQEEESTDQLLGLHPLDIYRTSHFLFMDNLSEAAPLNNDIDVETTNDDIAERPQIAQVRSARKLTEAGIRFLPADTSCVDDIGFRPFFEGKLYMPKLQLDDSTAYRFRNMMAFEAMHVGTSNYVTAYVLFVKDLLDSASDVRLLARNKILEHHLGHDNAVVRLFNGLTRDVTRNWENELWDMREDLEKYCQANYRSNRLRRYVCESWDNFKRKYLGSPWNLIALFTATLLLVADIVQTVYAIKSYNQSDKSEPTKTH